MNWLGLTLTRKFTLLLVGFLVLQTVQIGTGIYGLMHISREGTQINEAGKQRMRTLLLGNLMRQAVTSTSWDNAHRAFFESVLAEYDAYFPWLQNSFGELSGEHKSLAGLIVQTREAWEKDLRPLLVDADPAKHEAARAMLLRYESLAPIQVDRIDRIVSGLERDVRDDTRLLVIIQVTVLAMTLLMGLTGLGMGRYIVDLPLRRLIEATRSIAAGAYDKRVMTSSHDELGELADTFNRMAAAVGDKTSRIAALNEIAIQITSIHSLRELLDEIMRRGMQLTGAQAACVAFYSEEKRSFEEWITQGLSDHFVKNMNFRPGGLADETFLAATHILSNDRPETRHKLSRLTHEEGIVSFVCMPLSSHTSRLGVIYFYRKDRDYFLPDEIEMLNTFAHLAAGAIENTRLHERTQDLAVTDKLTGLRNRRMFDQRLTEEIAHATRNAKPLSLLMIDIDDFKRINDTHGHVGGDRVLQSLGHILSGQLWKVDLAARYGGEEFAVILPQTDFQAATNVAERIRRSIEETTIPMPDKHIIGVTVSVGVACFPRCGENPEGLIEHADQALYTAKKEGKNRVYLYRNILKAELDLNPGRIVELLNQSLDNIQPIVTAVSAKAAFYHEHTALVSEFAMQLADVLEIAGDERQTLYRAALLHEIGMIAVPDTVLNKQAPLTPEDWVLIQRHPIIAAEFLEKVPALSHLAPIVRHHHEHYDGSGYPDGLKGETIPYLARVLAVADTYASMIGEWVGRNARPPEEARAQLAAAAGTQLDPRIVTAFVQHLNKEAVSVG